MVKFTDIVKAFVKGIARSKVSLIGAAITTITFPVLVIAGILDVQGIIRNPYLGFFIYMVLSPLFITGLVLVFFGLFFFKGKEEVGLFTYDYLKEQFTAPNKFVRLRKLITVATFLTLLNVFVIGLVSYTGYHYTESVSFCGTFCHQVMTPEYTAYQNSPHSRVACVECHIGSGAEWFTKAKISGIKQLYAVAFNTYPRPIKTPIDSLRPVKDTCEECHRPEFFQGDKLIVKDKFLPDEKNTHVETVLLMKVGSGGYRGEKAHGIHWHVAPGNKIVYRYTDDARKTITDVTLTKPGGAEVVFSNDDGKSEKANQGTTRVMDCIDCHNRPTHIYLSPDEALDQKLLTGKIPTELPFIKRQAKEEVTRSYATLEEAKNSIATGLRSWYKKNYPDLVAKNPSMLNQAISGAQQAYAENVFPMMSIGWSTYQNFLGHGEDFDRGCFRCHDGSHRTATGETIPADCNTCHILLAQDDPHPKVLQGLRGSSNQ
ncbi:MAG: NapC/NirT family cytochrome c [Desulfobacteraceae bacterium]|nr:NapC/NirT family cytochrome c [Desulfobacteraceae bacterium]